LLDAPPAWASSGSPATSSPRPSRLRATTTPPFATSRAAFPATADRTGLSVRGDVPDDIERFTTLAEASYTAAGQDPFKIKLTKRGYPATRLTTLRAALDDLTATGGDQDESVGDAIDDTDARDKAYQALKTFMKELKGTARGALRGKNGLLAKLGL
jgi:hypothetical protein